MSQLIVPALLAAVVPILHITLTRRYNVSNTHQWAAAILPSVDVFVLIMCVIATFSGSRAAAFLWLLFLILLAITIWLHKSGLDSMN